MQVWSAPGMSKPTFGQAISQLANDNRPYRVGDWLGKSWTNHWVKAELLIPNAFLSSDEDIICESNGAHHMTGTDQQSNSIPIARVLSTRWTADRYMVGLATGC